MTAQIKSISIDMSTEEAPYNRIYAKPIERQGNVLLCEFESANYDISKKGKDFTTGISEEMYLDQLKAKENMIKFYQEENAQLKENIHSMLFTDDVVQDRYDKAKRDNEKLKKQLDVKEAMIKNYIAEIGTQRQQLAIAIEALKCYEQENWTYADEYNYFRLDEYTGGWCHAQKALEQIKELEK